MRKLMRSRQGYPGGFDPLARSASPGTLDGKSMNIILKINEDHI
jgi:hypothetical protein